MVTQFLGSTVNDPPPLHPAILQLQNLGYAPDDKVYIRLLLPKKLPIEIALKRGLAFRNEDNEIIPSPIDGYLTLTETGASFTRLKRDRETQEFAPTKTFNDGLGWLQTQNARGYGVYLVVNAGGREDKDIVRCPALFYECDKVSKEEQWRKVDSLKEAGLEPSLIIETRNSLHVYLNGEDILVSEFTELQQRLIQLQNSDPSILNPSRLMRLAGFKHQQWNVEANRFEEPVECTIHAANDNRYSLTHFDASLPPWDEERWKAKSKASRVKRKGQATERHEPLNASDNPYDLRNLAHYLEGYNPNGRRDWITCKCPAHNGVSDNSLHINVSSGAYTCHAGCNSKEIRANVIRIAKTLGHKFPRPKNNIVALRTPEELDAIETLQLQLRAFTYPVDIKINEQYLPKNLWSRIPKSGIVCLRAPKGSGKSTAIKLIIEQAVKEGRPVISITPRITLGEEQAVRWEINYINSLPSKGLSIEDTSTLGLCWDSLAKLFGKDLTNAVIIIDEAELGLTHLVDSETCEDNRPQILAAFESIVTETLSSNGLIILSDADLTNISVNYVKDLAPKDTSIFTVVNTHKCKKWKVRFTTGDRYSLERWVISSVNARNKIIICLDSQKEAEKLQSLIERECPGKKVIRVDKTTSRTEWCKSFVKHINEKLLTERPDVLIYTPSMGVGVSIDVPYFDEVVGLFFGQVEPSQCRQMLARVRHAVSRTIWAQYGNYRIKGNKSFLPDEIKQEIYRKNKGGIKVLDLAHHLTQLKSQSENETDALFLQNLIGTLQAMMSPEGTWRNFHVDLHANVKARQNYGRTHLSELLRQELIEEGHDVEAFKLTKNGAERIESNGTLTPAEIPVEISEQVSRILETPFDENAEPVTPQPLTPEQCTPLDLYIQGEHCASPEEYQAMAEAKAFTIADRDANQRTKEAMKELAEERLDQEAERWVAAQTVTLDEAYEIIRNPFAEEEEKIQAQKTLVTESLPEVPQTKEFVRKAIVSGKPWLNNVRNEWYLKHPEETKRKDRKTWIHHLRKFAAFVPFLPDVNTHEPKFQVLRDVGLLNFMEDVETEYSANHEAVQELFEACWRNRLKLKVTWGVVVTRNSKPIDLLNRLLEKVGLRLTPTRHARVGRERIRFYALDETLILDPDRLAVLASMDKKNLATQTTETITPEGLDPEQCTPDNLYNNGEYCATQTLTPPVRVRGKTIRIFATELYAEAMGVVVQGDMSSDCVTARILGGEYAGAEWVVPAGKYALLGAE